MNKLICMLLTGALATAHAATALAAAPATHAAKKEAYYSASRLTGNIEPVGKALPASDDLLKYGEWLYQGNCVRCHGSKGNGEGADWTLMNGEYDPVNWLPRQPRDFTDPVFKLRSTPSGTLATERDLFEAISRGLQSVNDMPSFKHLPERDRWALVAYIKTFTKRWKEEKQYPPIKISEPPTPTPEMLAAGKDVYKKMQCARCHGETGKGDGMNAKELKDDNRLPIVPRDFTDPSQFLGPSDPKGIYRTFSTGLDGTPMPSFADSLNETQRWQLVWHVISLRPGWALAQAQRELKKPALKK